MPTRYYITGIDVANSDISTSVSPEWETWSANNYRAQTTSEVSTTGGRGYASSTGTNNDFMIMYYVSDPIGAQTFSGTLKGQIRMRQTDVALKARTQIIAKVVSNNGSILRGYLYGGDLTQQTTNPASMFALTYENRKIPRGGPVAINNLTCENGDRIVFEVGYRIHSTSGTGYAGWVFLEGGLPQDLPEDETTTTNMNPWVELSHNVLPFDYIYSDTGSISSTESTFIRLPGQVILPTSTHSTGLWRTESGGTSLHTSMDETVLDLNDYAESTIVSTTPDVMVVKLASTSDPGRDVDHFVGYTISKDVPSARPLDITVTLLQGTTTIATWTHLDVPSNPMSIVNDLTETEAALITNYGDLYLRFSAVRG